MKIALSQFLFRIAVMTDFYDVSISMWSNGCKESESRLHSMLMEIEQRLLRLDGCALISNQDQ